MASVPSTRLPCRFLRAAFAIDTFHRRLAGGIAWLTLAMVLVGAYNAIARTLDNRVGTALSSNAYLEAQWYLFGIVFLLAAPYALRANAHVRVDVLYGGHGSRGRAWVDLLGSVLLAIPFCAFAIWTSKDFVVDSWMLGEMSNDPGGLPRWVLKPIVPLGFLLLLLQVVSEAIKNAAVLRGRSRDEAGLDEPGAQGGEGSA